MRYYPAANAGTLNPVRPWERYNADGVARIPPGPMDLLDLVVILAVPVLVGCIRVIGRV